MEMEKPIIRKVFVRMGICHRRGGWKFALALYTGRCFLALPICSIEKEDLVEPTRSFPGWASSSSCPNSLNLSFVFLKLIRIDWLSVILSFWYCNWTRGGGTVHWNRGHGGQFRFWPYSSIWTSKKSSVRLGKAVLWRTKSAKQAPLSLY